MNDKSDHYTISEGGVWTKKHDLLIPNSDGTDRTDNNVPYGAGYTLRICKHMIPIYQAYYEANNDFYKDNNIQEVIVMSDEDYMAMVRQNSENSEIDYSIVEGKRETDQNMNKDVNLVDLKNDITKET